MRLNPIPVIAALLLISLSLAAQEDPRYELHLKSGTFIPAKNLGNEKIELFNQQLLRSGGKSFVVIQFEQIPTEKEKQQLLNNGIQLLDYIPRNAYTAIITASLQTDLLLALKTRAIVQLSATQKMQPALAAGNFPAGSVQVAGTVDVWISFPVSFSIAEIKSNLIKANFEIISDQYKDYRILALRVPVQRLGELALLHFIEFVQAAPGKDQLLSPFWTNWGRDGVRATLLGAPFAVGGRNLKGGGVVVGIGDDADPQQHIDFTGGRLISRAAAGYNYHGTHVTGIVGGAGIRNELRTGFAPKSTIVSQVLSNVFTNAPAYVTDYGMVITNNSYGNNVTECNTFGVYDLYSRILDQQAFNLPNLQNVFAAGNSGLINCPPFPDSFRTVLGGYQSSKNVITVGNATPIGFIFERSSRGPVRDGRIKPEITAIGSFIESTAPPPFDYYGENTGTSMAAPAIAGGLALLYEKYRILHPPLPGQNPKNGLMKALVCNSGDDWGVPGPDYTHGFGVANFTRAVTMLEDGHYYESTITQAGPPQTNVVNVPAGTAELKVMLYWNDPAAAVLASQTLVNDLDLEVQTPSSGTVLPLILDSMYSKVKLPAVNGVDHINNVEQVVIKNPAAGNYTIRVIPTNITQNPSQEYFIVYDFVPQETRLVSPVGSENYVPGENMIVTWDSYGTPDNPFTLEYSKNNGANWSTLKNNIPANKRIYFFTTPDPNEWFTVPADTTDKALMRISRNGTGFTNTSLPFTITPLTTVTASANQCEGYFSIDWTNIFTTYWLTVTGANDIADYEVMMLQGDEMVSVAVVPNTTLNYTFSGLSKDSVYWVTVRPRINGHPGRRGIAISRKPDNGTCSNNISDNDIKIDSILSPAGSGRVLTSTVLSNSVPVSVRIKNLDDIPTSGNITITYTLSGAASATATETITNPLIAGGGTYVHTFASGNNIDVSAIGSYNLEVTITPQTIDPVPSNNTATKVFKQLDNPPITAIIYPSVFIDDFDSAPIQSHNTAQVGLQGLDRYDFVTNNDLGRIRTFINTGIAKSGNRAITLDTRMASTGGSTDSLTGTYNLATFNVNTDDIRLDFQYKNHGQLADPANKAWVRGDDTQNWIEAYDLFANQNDADGTYKKTSSIEVSDLLRGTQNFSSSFQLRIGEFGKQQAADNDGGAGYTFDDIRIYKVTDDMQLVSIDTPIVSSCGLTSTTPVKITVRNSSESIVSNVPVRFRVDGGTWLTPAESIPSIPANDTVQYTFTATADLSAPGSHTVEAVVVYASDTYRINDTAIVTLINSPVITVTNSAPHLENFESGNGSWYSGGKNSSWEYGTPNSYQVTRAASGSKAWKTRLAGFYNDQEKSYLYSPCYDISTVTNPYLSFSFSLDIEDCGNSACDGAYMEYSTDGKTWDTLGAYGQGTNWYNKNFSSGVELWAAQNYTRWHVATIPLTTIPVPVNQLTQLRLRLVIQSDIAVNRDGVAIDDIHIYNNPYGIYDGATMGSPITQNIPGAGSWVDFTSGGKLLTSVNSPVPMGSTDGQVYINTGSVRVNSQQYYHDRNITIKPATVSLADSATVRFYFLDTETETLINATGCAYCFKPSMAYELGVTKYSDVDDSKENGTLADNTGGIHTFINSSKTRIIPFDKGYYAEFKVKDFSEFWLSNGGLDRNTPLPLRLLSFTAKKKELIDVLAEWVTTSELNVDRFEIEVAKGNIDYQQNRFSRIGVVSSLGNSTGEQQYSFIDAESNKTNVRYYRLKMIDRDGTFSYSPIRPVVFTNDIKWQVYPNPSSGIFNLVYQVPEGETMSVRVYDASGKTVRSYQTVATGFLQKTSIDMQDKVFASGLYLLEASSGQSKQTFRLVKQ